MPKRKSAPLKEGGRRKRAPALTPEAREKQMVSLAYEVAEQQMREGTASPLVIAHFLKLGSSRDEKEQRLIEKRIDNLDAKTEAIYSSERVEKLYNDAIAAMRVYGGTGTDEDIQIFDDPS